MIISNDEKEIAKKILMTDTVIHSQMTKPSIINFYW